MKGRRKKQTSPKHKNKRDCKQPKPEKKSHEGMGRTTIKSRKGKEETQTIMTDKTENEWTGNINNSDDQEGTQKQHRQT